MKFSSLMVIFGMALLGCQGSGNPPADPSKSPADTSSSSDSAESDASKPAVEEPAPANPADESAEQVWRRFVVAWNGPDQKQLERFHARNGLIALDNPGAFVQMRLLQSVAELQALEGHYDLARLKGVRLNAELEAGDAPARSCEEDVPNKGTYRAPVDRFLLEPRFRALSEYDIAPPAEVSRLEGPTQAASEAARYAIYDLDSNVGFLFGDEGGRIVLLAIDAVIPCSA